MGVAEVLFRGDHTTVKDWGDGFDLHQAMKGGLGLISMEERVRAEGGSLTIRSREKEGTTVTAFVPFGYQPPPTTIKIHPSGAA